MSGVVGDRGAAKSSPRDPDRSVGIAPEETPTKSILCAVYAIQRTVEVTDAELIHAVIDGSDSAFASLIGRYQDRVFRLLSRYTRDVAECEDLAQEVFLKVFRKLHTFHQDSAFFTWLYRIAVNTATDHLSRRARRRLALVEDETKLDTGTPRSPSSPVDQAMIDAELVQVTRTILDKLPEKYRTILVLREYEDLSYTDIANLLELNLGTVESRLFRARQRFKLLLLRLYPEHAPSREGQR